MPARSEPMESYTTPAATALRRDDAPPFAVSEERVEAHLASIRARVSRFIMVWALVVNVVWWTTDRAVMGHLDGVVEAFFRMRLTIAGTCAAALLVLWRQTELQGVRLGLCVALWLVLFGGVGYGVSTIGPLSAPWFHCLYPLVLATMPLPLGLRRRLLVTTLMSAALLVGFFLGRPDAASDPFLPVAAGYLVFTVVVALAFGHRIELLTRESFVVRLALEHSEAVIRRQRESLRDQVDERTRELRLLAGHLDQGAEAERRRIARELHDDLGQSVSALRFSMETARRRYARDPASIRANLSDLDALVGRVADDTRDAVTRLRPRILDDRGLIHATEWLVETTARHSGLEVWLELEGQTAALEPGEAALREAGPVESAAFRILQESLTNAVKHSGATRVSVRIAVDPEGLRLSVADNGGGLQPMRDGAMGLITMRERARSLDGTLTLHSLPGQGVRVECRLPLPRREVAPTVPQTAEERP